MILASLVLLAVADAATPVPPADFVAYVDVIRERGASEMATNDLSSLVSILTDPETLSFTKDPASGEYWPSYRAGGIYGRTPTAQENRDMREAGAARTSTVLPILRDLADADRSGFVSTSEARHLRRIVEFGRKAVFILASEPADIGQICRLTRTSRAEAGSFAAEYERVRRAFKDVPMVTLPALALPAAP